MALAEHHAESRCSCKDHTPLPFGPALWEAEVEAELTGAYPQTPGAPVEVGLELGADLPSGVL